MHQSKQDRPLEGIRIAITQERQITALFFAAPTPVVRRASDH